MISQGADAWYETDRQQEGREREAHVGSNRRVVTASLGTLYNTRRSGPPVDVTRRRAVGFLGQT
jgi:hypothetical protein